MLLLCHWCLCVIGGTLLDCSEGSRQAMLIAARGANTPGELFLTECHSKGEAPLVDLQTKCRRFMDEEKYSCQ